MKIETATVSVTVGNTTKTLEVEIGILPLKEFEQWTMSIARGEEVDFRDLKRFAATEEDAAEALLDLIRYPAESTNDEDYEVQEEP